MRGALLTVVLISLLPALTNAQNKPPVADAGPDKAAYTGLPVVLNGTATDPDGDPILDWSWAVEQAPAPHTYRVVSGDTANLILIGYVQGDYMVSLSAGDGIDIGVDYATVRVKDNVPPVAALTSDRTSGPAPLTVCFDGSQSYDPEGAPLAFAYDLADGTFIVDVLTFCHVYSHTGSYTVGLRVTDELRAIDFDYRLITVLPAAAVSSLPRSGLAVLGVLLAVAGAVQVSRRVEGKA